MDSLYLVMPAYNEEENIRDVVDQWYPILAAGGPDSRLVVADSGSTDHTHAILQDLQQTHPQLEILSDTGKYHGPKVIALYRHAVNRQADYIFQTDSDGQTSPAEFSAFWQMRREYDGIFGYRRVRGDGLVRAFVEKVVCLLLQMYFGVRVPDANAPFRLMKTTAVQKYLDRFDADYNLPNIMMTTFFVYYHEKYLFREISFSPRRKGKNSINIKKIIVIGLQALKDFASFKKQMKRDREK